MMKKGMKVVSRAERDRLLEIARELELSEVVVSVVEELSEEGSAEKERTAGRMILRELVVRQNSWIPPLPDAQKNRDLAKPLLDGLDELSRRELRDLDERIGRSQDRVRSCLDELPEVWRARCRTVVAKTPLGEGMVEVGPLRRALADGVRDVGLQLARRIHRRVSADLAEAVDVLYPLATTADQILRVIEHRIEASAKSGASPLVDQLSTQRTRWRGWADWPPGDDTESAGFCGSLMAALGIEIVAASLLRFESREISTDAAPDSFRSGLFESVWGAVRAEWQARRASIQDAVDAHVARRFLILQREIDGWLDHARAHVASLCGVETKSQQEMDAIRFEVLDICRLGTDGPEPKETSA